MQKITLLLSLFLVNFLTAQEITYNPKTGDVSMDGFLKEVNSEAVKDIKKFTDNVATKFNIAKADIDKLLKDMAPGDVYMSAQVANVVTRPVTEVSTAYNKNKGKGWGVIAKEMGIKPGSPEFHKLKNSMKKDKSGKGKDDDKGGKDDDKGEGGEEHGKGHGNGHGKGHGKK